MAFKEGRMSTDQLKEYFGDSLQVRDDGHVTFSNDGDIDKFMGDKKLRNYFVNELGRSTDDWDDGEKSANDLGTVVRSLHSGGGGSEAPRERVEWEKSDELKAAEQRLNDGTYAFSILQSDAGKQDLGSGDPIAGDAYRDPPKTEQEGQAQNLLEKYKDKVKRST